MLTCLKRFKATNVHFMLKTSLEGKSTGFLRSIFYTIRLFEIVLFVSPRFEALVVHGFSRISIIVNVSKIVTVVFRGQKDCDQRSRPNFKAKLYDNEGNRFYGTRRAFKLSLTKIYHLASVLATVRQLFASKTASLLRCRGEKEKTVLCLRLLFLRRRIEARFVEYPRNVERTRGYRVDSKPRSWLTSCRFLSIRSDSFIVFNYRIDNAIKIHRVTRNRVNRPRIIYYFI